MKAITILIRCRNAENDLRRIRQRIRQRQDAAECTAPVMSTTGGHSKNNTEPDRIAVLTCAITELEAALETRENARRAEVAAVCVFLDTLSETESAVMYSYFVNRLKIGAIASKLNFTDGYIRKVKSDAEKKLDTLDDAMVKAALPPWYIKEYGGAI